LASIDAVGRGHNRANADNIAVADFMLSLEGFLRCVTCVLSDVDAIELAGRVNAIEYNGC
jgi:hypothetical protein